MRRRPKKTGETIRRPSPRPAKRAFTLAEVLLALALTVLMVTVAGRIAVNSVVTRQVATRAVTQVERQAVLFELLREDVAQMLMDLPVDQTALMVFGGERPVLQLTTLAAVPAEAEALHVPKVPATVRYRLVRADPNAPTFDLLREVIDLTQVGGTPVPQTVARRVSDFTVEVLCEEAWTTKYPPAEEEPAVAVALRVGCSWDTDKVTRTFVLPLANTKSDNGN